MLPIGSIFSDMNDAARFDELLDAGCEPSGDGCRYCQGDGAAEDPCSEECAEGMWRARRRQRILALKATIFRATQLAQTYRAEEGVEGERERAVQVQIAACEAEIRAWVQSEFGDPTPPDSLRGVSYSEERPFLCDEAAQ